MQTYHHFSFRRVFAVFFSLLLVLTAAVPSISLDAEAIDAGQEHVHVPAGDPEWNWAEDYSACTAVFTCVDCGETFTCDAAVVKEWKWEGPDENGNGIYYFTANVRVNDHSYWDFTPVFETEGYQKPNPCPLDGIDHGDSFLGKLTRFFHDVVYKLIHLFELNQSN